VTASSQPRGVVTVGTDHHRFDRLMDWLDGWNAAHPGAVRWTVQHGSSRPLAGVAGYVLKPHAELLEDLRQADLVVTQGGPGGIMDSRACGVLPIVVPRLAHLDEVVDDHQVAFARQLAERGLVELAESEIELHAVLDRAVRSPEDFAVSQGPSDVARTVATFGAAVDALVAGRPARRRLLRRR
jgi:UDP-N-acetylglucosamine transferase subunit ALG13